MVGRRWRWRRAAMGAGLDGAHAYSLRCGEKEKAGLGGERGKSDGARAVGDGVGWRTSAGEGQVGVAGGVAGGAVGKPAREG